MLYSYQKATRQLPVPGKIIPRYVKVLPIVVSALGLAMVAAVIWPIAGYQLSLIFGQQDRSGGLLNPVVYETFASEENSTQAPSLVADVDYTKASNWFTFSPVDDPNSASGFIDLNASPSGGIPPVLSQEYQLSIPSLGIKEANVSALTDDLTKNLIQYKQSAFPGQFGAPVIFGHSTLPQFFNPKNYLTIFSTLPQLKIGADIFVDYAGVKYTYRIGKMYEVNPADTWVLRQDYNQKTLKLITCVPPGTKLRRLVVEAELIKS